MGETKWKSFEVKSSEKSDKATKNKMQTALDQKQAAADLHAESCIAVCMEGSHKRSEAKKAEKEEKMQVKVAALMAPKTPAASEGADGSGPIAAAPFQGKPPSEVSLMEGVSLIQTAENSDCDPPSALGATV